MIGVIIEVTPMPFTPTKTDLLPMPSLLVLAQVNDKSVEVAITAYRAKPPDELYKNLLDAEIL